MLIILLEFTINIDFSKTEVLVILPIKAEDRKTCTYSPTSFVHVKEALMTPMHKTGRRLLNSRAAGQEFMKWITS